MICLYEISTQYNFSSLILSKVLPVKLIEVCTLLYHHKNCYTLFNDLPDPILLEKTFYELSCDVRIFIFAFFR